MGRVLAVQPRLHLPQRLPFEEDPLPGPNEFLVSEIARPQSAPLTAPAVADRAERGLLLRHTFQG